MSDVVVQVAETTTTVSVTETSVNVNVVESPVQVSVGTSGPQGAGVPDGGSAGQFLAKASATDYDTSWVDHINTVIQEYVKNDGASLSKGQAVYVSGANGTNIIVSAADNSTEATSSKTIGLLLQNLAINEFGYVVTQGRISGLDTSAATAGDAVWLGTSGNLIYGLANKPVAPANLVYLGVVTRAHANQGEIFVSVQNGFELNELHSVLITSPSNNQVLSYDSATSLWKNTAGTVAYASTSGTAVYADTAGSATPTAHAASHGSAGSDPVTLAQSQVTDLTTDLAARALLTTNTFSGTQTFNGFTQTFNNSVVNGRVTIGPSSLVAAQQLNVTSQSATNKGLVVQGAASQSANLQEWQDSAGTVLAGVLSGGSIYTTGGSFRAGTSGTFGARINAQTVSTTDIGLVIRGASSQSADLAQWQNSAGTVLAKVDSSGNILGSSVQSITGYISMTEENSGGRLRFTKLTSAATNPGANLAKLYFRDGTNAGTLKLVVRAGAAGAETTILDNIPQ